MALVRVENVWRDLGNIDQSIHQSTQSRDINTRLDKVLRLPGAFLFTSIKGCDRVGVNNRLVEQPPS